MKEANAELERVGVKREDRLDVALVPDEGNRSENEDKDDDCEGFKGENEKDSCNTIHVTKEEIHDRQGKESASSLPVRP